MAGFPHSNPGGVTRETHNHREEDFSLTTNQESIGGMIITGDNNLFMARWKQGSPYQDVTMKFSRFEEVKMDVKCELMVTVANRNFPEHEGRITITSETSKMTAAGRCEKSLDAYPWGDLIRNATNIILQRFREGEPMVDLRDVPKRESAEFIVEPILYRGQPNLLYGDGSLGKSLFATYVAVLVASGRSTSRLSPEPGNVLYLDYEADEEELRDRHQWISDGLDLASPPPFLYRRIYQPIASDIERTRELVMDNDIDFVVIDSAAPACGGRPEEAHNVLQYFTALRSLKATTLTIAHVAKGDGGADRGAFGSIFWKNMSRSVWEVTKGQEPGEDKIDFGLFHRKVNRGMLRKPMAYLIDFSQNMIRFRDMRITDSEVLSQKLSVKERIKKLLYDKRRFMTVVEIAEALTLVPNQVSPNLSIGEKEGIFHHENNKYGLITHRPY
jgi:hypothetical protein